MLMKKVSLTLPPPDVEAIDEIAVKRRRSRSFIITEAIEKYLANGQAKPTTTTKKKAGTR